MDFLFLEFFSSLDRNILSTAKVRIDTIFLDSCAFRDSIEFCTPKGHFNKIHFVCVGIFHYLSQFPNEWITFFRHCFSHTLSDRL